MKEYLIEATAWHNLNEWLGFIVNIGTVGHWLFLLLTTMIGAGLGGVAQQVLRVPASYEPAYAGEIRRRSLGDHIRQTLIEIIIRPEVPVGRDFFRAIALFIIIVLFDIIGIPYFAQAADSSLHVQGIESLERLHALFWNTAFPLAAAALNVMYVVVVAYLAARIFWKVRNLP